MEERKKGGISPVSAYRREIALALLVIAAVMLYRFFNPAEEIRFQFGETSATFGVSDDSAPAVELAYSDIVSVYVTDELDVGTGLSGIDTKSCRFGVWQNEAFGEYTLCVFPSVSRYIVLETADSAVVFNCEDADTTSSMFTALTDMLAEKQQQ